MPEDPKRTPVAVATAVSHRERYREVLSSVSVTMHAGECWVVVGPNGSGKSILTEVLAGVREPYSGTIEWPGLSDPDRDAAVVSFESLERVLASERRSDLSSVMHGRLDPGHTVRDVIDAAAARGREAHADAAGGRADATIALARRFGLAHIADRGLRFLSTGEFRKTLLAAAVARSPRLLVLDEPYDGLDAASRRELGLLVNELHSPDRCLVLVLNRRRDVPAVATHVLELAGGRAVFSGPADRWSPPTARATRERASAAGPAASPHHGASAAGAGPLPRATVSTSTVDDTLIKMHKVGVAYEGTPILRDVSWTVRRCDRWMIVGPNGSGKSTLLSLVTGDNAKAYGQEVELFGRRKGSGESVWEIKRRIGWVSGDLQLAYPLRTTVEETVLSGFHDSIGLFEEPSGYEREVAREWIARIGLSEREDRKLRELSFGERRMVLVARAVVKRPELLIADEPTQGLDDEHAAMVLALLDRIGRETESCLLYVTHDPDERLACATHVLELVPDTKRGSSAIVRPTGAP